MRWVTVALAAAPAWGDDMLVTGPNSSTQAPPPSTTSTTTSSTWEPVVHPSPSCPDEVIGSVQVANETCGFASAPAMRIGEDGSEIMDRRTTQTICSSNTCIIAVSRVQNQYKDCQDIEGHLGVQARFARALQAAADCCLRASVQGENGITFAAVVDNLNVGVEDDARFAVNTIKSVLSASLGLRTGDLAVQLRARDRFPQGRRLGDWPLLEAKIVAACPDQCGTLARDVRRLESLGFQEQLRRAGLPGIQISGIGLPVNVGLGEVLHPLVIRDDAPEKPKPPLLATWAWVLLCVASICPGICCGCFCATCCCRGRVSTSTDIDSSDSELPMRYSKVQPLGHGSPR